MTDTSRRQSSLHHFTIEVEGTTYGGWYRMMPNDCLEVLAIGLMQVRPLDGRGSGGVGRAVASGIHPRT
jgi:hypothetical protein